MTPSTDLIDYLDLKWLCIHHYAQFIRKCVRTLTHTALLAPTEHSMEESGENAQLYTQFGCPLSIFIMFPEQKQVFVSTLECISNGSKSQMCTAELHIYRRLAVFTSCLFSWTKFYQHEFYPYKYKHAGLCYATTEDSTAHKPKTRNI